MRVKVPAIELLGFIGFCVSELLGFMVSLEHSLTVPLAVILSEET